MKNNLFLIGGGIVVFILGVGMFMSFNKKDDVQREVTKTFGNLSIRDGVKCTQTANVGEDGNSVTSTIYFYKDKLRYDSVMKDKVQGQKDIHSITDGEYTYIWGEGTIGSMFGGASNKGMKIKNDEENNYAPDVNAEELEKENFNAPGLNCEKWSPDSKIFELPKDIEFETMDQMLNASMPQTPPQSTATGDAATPQAPNMDDMCAICDSIPDATAKAECKKSCNE